jgi:hypothetical protein
MPVIMTRSMGSLPARLFSLAACLVFLFSGASKVTARSVARLAQCPPDCSDGNACTDDECS